MRFERLKIKVINFLIEKNPEEAPYGIAHLAYSASLCGLLARKRGLDMEIAETTGWLHDVWLRLNAPYDQETCRRHAHEGALLAGEIMTEMGEYSRDEMMIIMRAIENHDFLNQVDDPMSELMKDCDMLSHYINEMGVRKEGQYPTRVALTLSELGVI